MSILVLEVESEIIPSMGSSLNIAMSVINVQVT